MSTQSLISPARHQSPGAPCTRALPCGARRRRPGGARLSRLLEMIALLQAGIAGDAGALARWFGVSRQRIYQDVSLLRKTGVPVRRGSHGYALGDGFFMPPLSLTLDEVASLLLPMDLSRCGTARARALTSAVSKLLASVPPAVRERACLLDRQVRGIADMDRARPEVVGRLVQSMLDQRRIALLGATPSTIHKNGTDWSVFDPYGFINEGGQWHVTGLLAAEGAVTTFPVAHVQAIEVTQLHFSIPEGFSIDDHRPVRA